MRGSWWRLRYPHTIPKVGGKRKVGEERIKILREEKSCATSLLTWCLLINFAGIMLNSEACFAVMHFISIFISIYASCRRELSHFLLLIIINFYYYNELYCECIAQTVIQEDNKIWHCTC